MSDRFIVTNVRTYVCQAGDGEQAKAWIRELAGDAEPDLEEWFVALAFDDEGEGDG